MSSMLVDSRKAPVPTFPKVPGGCREFNVTAATPVVFTPSPALVRATTYEVRTTADIRCIAHPTGYVFAPANEPVQWGGEIDWVELGPANLDHPRQSITMQALAADAQVWITELA